MQSHPEEGDVSPWMLSYNDDDDLNEYVASLDISVFFLIHNEKLRIFAPDSETQRTSCPEGIDRDPCEVSR